MAFATSSACATGSTTAGAGTDASITAAGSIDTTVARPLAQLANRQVAVFPVQRLSRQGGARWGPDDARGYLRSVDDEIAFALDARGLRRGWTTPDAMARIADRNPAFNVDARALSVPPTPPLRPGDELREPLGSQLRSLAAFADARFAIVPLELMVGEADGAPRAMLRVALVDVRLARVLWVGDTAPARTNAADPGPALAAGVAERFTDLIVAPPES